MQQNLDCTSEGSLENNLMSYIHYSKSFYRNLSAAASYSISAAFSFSAADTQRYKQKIKNKQTKNLATSPPANTFTKKRKTD